MCCAVRLIKLVGQFSPLVSISCLRIFVRVLEIYMPRWSDLECVCVCDDISSPRVSDSKGFFINKDFLAFEGNEPFEERNRRGKVNIKACAHVI